MSFLHRVRTALLPRAAAIRPTAPRARTSSGADAAHDLIRADSVLHGSARFMLTARERRLYEEEVEAAASTLARAVRGEPLAKAFYQGAEPLVLSAVVAATNTPALAASGPGQQVLEAAAEALRDPAVVLERRDLLQLLATVEAHRPSPAMRALGAAISERL